MAKYPGLWPRGDVWYVRKKVPIDLRQLYTNDQVRKSLNARDKRTALRLYASKMDEIVREFEIKRAQLNRKDPITLSLLTARLERLTPAEIDVLVWDWWEKRIGACLQGPDRALRKVNYRARSIPDIPF